MKRKIRVLVCIAAVLSLMFSFTIISNAAPKIQSNVSTTAVSANLSSRSLPNAVSEIKTGTKYYFNIAATNSNYIKNFTLYCRCPGESSFHQVDSITAKNYMRYTAIPITFGEDKVGTFYYYWTATYKDRGGKDTFRTRSINIVSSNSNSSNSTSASNDYSESRVRVKSNGQVVDTFNGISAKYIKGNNNSNTGTYSCAGLVKSYYSKNYGVTVTNLLKNRTPNASRGRFTRTTSPQPGDIVYHTNSGGGGHWMILKAVNSDGTYTVFEQNCKWVASGKTYTFVNRHISTDGRNSSHKVSNLKFFRYNK